MEGKRAHRRCRSEGGAGAALAQWEPLQSSHLASGVEHEGVADMRTVSLDTSASEFMQSLALHEARASQTQIVGFDAHTAAPDQSNSSRRGHAVASPNYAAAQAASDAWPGVAEITVSAGSKRSHDSSKSSGRGSKDGVQPEGKKESMHQHKHSFTPALPAVEEMTAEDAYDNDDRDDDEDYDSDSLATPTGRRTSGSRSRARRGGYNGRSENELLLLDPKRVKRILANRQSAARSKERRMNYTMQLEGKLQNLSQEVDKLNAQLDGLQGQSKALMQARTELEQQVETLQKQLSQTTAENQALVSELFGLQRALGLPQAVPKTGEPPPGFSTSQQTAVHPAVVHSAPRAQYDSSAQQYGPAGQQYCPPQASHWQQYNAAAPYGEYPNGSAVLDAAAVEALHARSQLQHQQQPQHHRRGSSSSSIGYPPGPETLDPGRHMHANGPIPGAAAAAPPMLAVPGTGMPPLPPNGRSPSYHAAAPAGPAAAVKPSSTSFAGQAASPRIPSPSPSAAAAGARLPSPALAGSLSIDAAVAADALLMDASVGEDAAMTNEDDLEMLSVFLDDSPLHDPAAGPAAVELAAGGRQGSTGAADSYLQQQQQQQQGGAAAEAAQGHLQRPAQPGSLGLSHSDLNLQTQQGPALGPGAALSWPMHSSPGTEAAGFGLAPGLDRSAGYNTTLSNVPKPNPAPGLQQNPGINRPNINARVLCSPAFSDPMGEGFHDDVSSGSLAGSLTPNTSSYPRTSDCSIGAAGMSRQHGAPPAGPWQQQQQQMGAAVSPHTPGTGSATAAAAAGAMHPLGVAAVLPHAAHPAEQQQQLHQRHQQQHMHGDPVAAAAAPVLPDPAHVNFTMGANPAARHRRSASYGAAVVQHHRSASAGSIGAFAWPDTAAFDRIHWSMQSYGPPPPSSNNSAAAMAAATAGVGLRPGSPFQQQQQYTGGNSSMFVAPPAAGGLGHHRSSRVSAPGLHAGLGEAAYPGPAAAAGFGSSGYDRLPYAVDAMPSGVSRQPQHRRSYSHAGTYAHHPYSAAVGPGSGEHTEQLDHIHPAALGPAGPAAAVSPAAAAALPVFGHLGRSAAAGVGADVHGLNLPTRIVTTSNTLDRGR